LVQAASTADVSLPRTGTATVDGVALVEGDRVLLKDQATGSENGVYLVHVGPNWERDPNLSVTANYFTGQRFYVQAGTANADTFWTLATDTPFALDATALTFSETTVALADRATTAALGSDGDHGTRGGGTLHPIATDAAEGFFPQSYFFNAGAWPTPADTDAAGWSDGSIWAEKSPLGKNQYNVWYCYDASAGLWLRIPAEFQPVEATNPAAGFAETDSRQNPNTFRLNEHFLIKAGGSLPLPWATQTTDPGTAAPTTTFVSTSATNDLQGEVQLALSVDNEAETHALTWNDGLWLPMRNQATGGIIQARIRFAGEPYTATTEVVFGVMGAYSSAFTGGNYAWFKVKTGSDLFIECNDGSGAQSEDTTINVAAATVYDLKIDLTDSTAVRFLYKTWPSGAWTEVTPSPLDFSNVADHNFQPVVGIKKTTGAVADDVWVDYVDIWWQTDE